MTARTPYLYEIVFTDGRVERAVFYARSRPAADLMAEAWAKRLGVDVAPLEEDAA